MCLSPPHTICMCVWSHTSQRLQNKYHKSQNSLYFSQIHFKKSNTQSKLISTKNLNTLVNFKKVAKGPDQGALRSTELCVFPPSKFIRQQIDAFSFRILQALKVSNPKISNFLFFWSILGGQQVSYVEAFFYVQTRYFKRCVFLLCLGVKLHAIHQFCLIFSEFLESFIKNRNF